MLKKIIEKIKNRLKFLNPPPKIGGLEISDSALRYLSFENGQLKQASLRLPAGIVRNGQVKDKVKLISALTTLHNQLASARKPINVVVVISSASVYTQMFNLPLLARGRLEEAARLNLEMISPLDVQNAYYDWEMLGEEEAGGGRFEILGAFVSADIIDDLSSCLEASQFVVVAIESTALSLGRVVRQMDKWDPLKPYLVFNLLSEGLEFFIVKKRGVYFDQFVNWETVPNLELLKKMINHEMRRIMNFYTSRWGGIIEDVVVVNASANKEIIDVIKNNFKVNIKILSLPNRPQLPIGWLTAAGAALRGLVPRSKDIFISLARTGTEDKFYQSRVLTFSKLWRNIVIAVVGGLLVIYGLADFIFVKSLAGLEEQLADLPQNVTQEEAQQLENQAQKFNTLVDKAAVAKDQSLRWSPFFFALQNLAVSGRVILTQIQLQPSRLSVSLMGRAQNERQVLDFKNKLAGQPNFEEVILPLTAIKLEPGGQARFTVNFKLKQWPPQSP